MHDLCYVTPGTTKEVMLITLKTTKKLKFFFQARFSFVHLIKITLERMWWRNGRKHKQGKGISSNN